MQDFGAKSRASKAHLGLAQAGPQAIILEIEIKALQLFFQTMY